MSVFIILDIGINHNGDLNIAKKLIDVAKFAGADAVKFQKRTIDLCYNKEFLDSPRESPWGTTQREQKEGLEFSADQYDEIDEYCAQRQIDWSASAWDIQALEFLDDYEVPFHKVASAMIHEEAFLKEVAKRGKMTYVSTGMCEEAQINEAFEIFIEAGCSFMALHCVGEYPMKPEHANLKMIEMLETINGEKSGYSDHSGSLSIPYAAVALGAKALEVHITLDRAMYGSDQKSSLEPGAVIQLCGAVRKIEQAIGTGEKVLLDCEKKTLEKLRSVRP